MLTETKTIRASVLFWERIQRQRTSQEQRIAETCVCNHYNWTKILMKPGCGRRMVDRPFHGAWRWRQPTWFFESTRVQAEIQVEHPPCDFPDGNSQQTWGSLESRITQCWTCLVISSSPVPNVDHSSPLTVHGSLQVWGSGWVQIWPMCQ